MAILTGFYLESFWLSVDHTLKAKLKMVVVAPFAYIYLLLRWLYLISSALCSTWQQLLLLVWSLLFSFSTDVLYSVFCRVTNNVHIIIILVLFNRIPTTCPRGVLPIFSQAQHHDSHQVE